MENQEELKEIKDNIWDLIKWISKEFQSRSGLDYIDMMKALIFKLDETKLPTESELINIIWEDVKAIGDVTIKIPIFEQHRKEADFVYEQVRTAAEWNPEKMFFILFTDMLHKVSAARFQIQVKIVVIFSTANMRRCLLEFNLLEWRNK